MRLAIVLRNITISSGIYRVVSTYLRSGLPHRIQVELVTLKDPEPACRLELEALGIPIHTLNDSSSLSSLWRLRAILRERAIQVVIGTTWKSYVMAKCAAFATGTKTAMWLHAIHYVIEGVPRTILFRLLARPDPIIFVSKAVQERHRYGWHSGQEYIVYNGLETLPELYGRAIRSEIGVPEDAFVLAYTAEFKQCKAHETLLRAFRGLVSERPDLHLVLIGAGETFDSMAEMVRNLDLSGHVQFLGRRPDARQLLGAFDVYVHPSDGEAFGLALAEAMAAGVPVVAAKAGAIPELVRDETDGLLFPPSEAEGLTRCLSRVIDDADLRKLLGSNAQRAIREKFSAAGFSKSLTAVLDEIAQERPGSPQELSPTVEEQN